MNIYQAIENKKYTYELGKQNYNKIEEIRYRNESILSILDSCVSAGSVNNIDLFTLYFLDSFCSINIYIFNCIIQINQTFCTNYKVSIFAFFDRTNLIL